jgi:hypothetical protein
MSWSDRVQDKIILTSPQGVRFTAGWIGDDISGRKRLGVHEYPGVDGAYIQDMGLEAVSYPLSLYIDGEENDRDAARLMNAFAGRGNWEVIHPVYGLKKLQLVSYKLQARPVSSGGLTVIETEWTEGAALPLRIKPESVKALSLIDKLKLKEINAMLDMALDAAAAIASYINMVKSVMNMVLTTIGKITDTINAYARLIENILALPAQAVLETTSALCSLIEAPALFAENVLTIGRMYENLAENVSKRFNDAGDKYSNLGESNSDAARNEAMVGELTYTAAVCGTALAIIKGDIKNRRQCLDALKTFISVYDAAEETLDGVSGIMSGLPLHKQYFPFKETMPELRALRASITGYLLNSMFDLSAERIIVLDRPRSPLEVAVTEYKAASDTAEYYYNKLVEDNNLRGEELLLIAKGREVAVYV